MLGSVFLISSWRTVGDKIYFIIEKATPSSPSISVHRHDKTVYNERNYFSAWCLLYEAVSMVQMKYGRMNHRVLCCLRTQKSRCSVRETAFDQKNWHESTKRNKIEGSSAALSIKVPKDSCLLLLWRCICFGENCLFITMLLHEFDLFRSCISSFYLF